MHLWKDGDVQKVDEYLDQHALQRNELFKRGVQSLIELSTNSERSLLETWPTALPPAPPTRSGIWGRSST